MDEHFTLFQFVLHDIKDGHKVDLRDCCWYKRYIIQNDNTYYKKFPWKQTLIEKSLEGAAVYIG